jgi:hypothetical protein
VKDAESAVGRKDIARELEKRREKKTERFRRHYRRDLEDDEAFRRWKKALRHP